MKSSDLFYKTEILVALYLSLAGNLTPLNSTPPASCVQMIFPVVNFSSYIIHLIYNLS